MEFKKKKNKLIDFGEKALGALELEVILTQKCNLSCAHCMRGDAQNKDISKETLDAIFSKFFYIENLSLGGGEISLNPNLIKMLTQSLKENKTIANHVNFTTNGTFVSDEFLDNVKELEDYIKSCNGKFSLYEQDKNFLPLYILFSFDDFHLNEIISKGYSLEDILKVIGKYSQRFDQNAIECRISCDVDILNTGRAKTLQTNIPKVETIPYEYSYFSGENSNITVSLLTISTSGDFIPTHCSFDEEKQLSFGNIHSHSLNEIFSNMNMKRLNNSRQVNREKAKFMKSFTSSESNWKRYKKAGGQNKINYLNYMIGKTIEENQPE